jgi:hypothetical protein
MQKDTRETRLSKIAKVLTEADITPQSNLFSSKVNELEYTWFPNVTSSQRKEDKIILIGAYKADHWKRMNDIYDLIKTDLPYEPSTPQIPTENIIETEYIKRLIVKEELKKIGVSTPEEIKKVTGPASTQPDYLTEEQQADLLYKLASENKMDGVGRILRFEARDSLDNKRLSCKEIIGTWQKFYPHIEIEQKTDNVILVYFAGKDGIRDQRRQREPIIPEKFP